LLVKGVTFSPDGRTVVVTSSDGYVLVCDVTGLATAPGILPQLALTASDIENLYMDLASDNGARTHRAIWTLAAAGRQAVKGIEQRLQPVKRLDPKEAAALIDDLDSSTYAVREKAMQKLAQLESARPALEEALANSPPLEVRRRIELVLAKLPDIPWDSVLLQDRRAVAALEQIGTAEARQLLQSIAEGVSEARLTKAARESLDRLAK
jgi:hypothetical protein